MPRKTLLCVASLACAALVLTSRPAIADDKDKPALSGTWALKGGEPRIEFADKETLKVFPHGENAAIVIVCKYTTGKDGLVKAKITELEATEEIKEKAKGVIPVGLEFSFKWQAKGEDATLDDLKCEKSESLKSRLEGKYEKK